MIQHNEHIHINYTFTECIHPCTNRHAICNVATGCKPSNSFSDNHPDSLITSKLSFHVLDSTSNSHYIHTMRTCHIDPHSAFQPKLNRNPMHLPLPETTESNP